ncbi:AP-1 complex subunit mu-2 [Camellia lanceoleosa]|uniref:AP-1 complex subunit mu-2 n=1 Tax=Camellia lanceoleosa TaxID=1840588 RepID=A0ACC0IZQ7_9ERIC|nr:AP-1 complex subunit mu-2 [Camellia lanceoleosa]
MLRLSYCFVDATNPNVRTSLGSASYALEKDALIWKIKSFPGERSILFDITSENLDSERKAPIRVKFEIPYFAISGIQVSPL